MFTKTTNQFQFQVMSDDMYLLSELASRNGWDDVERFWQGEMITMPMEVKGWKLIPADQYKYSIPSEAVGRVFELLNAGVKIQGIVIADDIRSYDAKQKPAKPSPQKADPKPRKDTFEPVQINWDFVLTIFKILGVITAVIAAVITLSALLAVIATVGVGILVVAGILGALAFDPKLIVLISDGNGGTIWVCLYTWFEAPSKE